jgi:hypothetical protein
MEIVHYRRAQAISTHAIDGVADEPESGIAIGIGW